jgi:ribonuclease VapC
MIVVDTSALLAVVLNDTRAEACRQALQHEGDILMSAGTVVEALIVAGRRDVGAEMTRVIYDGRIEIVPVTSASARRAAAAHEKWGKGVHPAGLNFGDCFAYELAKDRRVPLLFIGDDFSRTDLASVL